MCRGAGLLDIDTHLVEAAGGHAERSALFAFNEAGQALGTFGDELSAIRKALLKGQFVSTWKYILKKGGLF